MTLNVACFNADWSRRASVNTQQKLTGVLSHYIAHDMALPTTAVLSEVNAGTARATARLAGATYDVLNEKVGYDHLALLWDSARLEKTGAHAVSTVGKYIVAPFTVRDSGAAVVMAAAHLPFKRARRNVGGSVLDRAHGLLSDAVDAAVVDARATMAVIGGDMNTPPDVLAEKFPDYELAFTDADITTCHRTCPDNVMVWMADDAAAFDRRIYDECRHFDHYPLWVCAA